MAVTEYIGARYLTVFADPIEWSNTKTYENFTVVQHNGDSYVSKQFVPIGVDISDTRFWLHWADYNAQIEQYRRETQQAVTQIEELYDSSAAEYANKYGAKPFAFDTVADMRNSRDLLYIGAICHTNGFHTNGDGGAAWYVISDSGTANGRDVISCGTTLRAKIAVIGDSITPEMLGAYGNGVTDDTESVLKCAELASTHKIPMRGIGTYAHDGYIQMPENLNCIDCHFISTSVAGGTPNRDIRISSNSYYENCIFDDVGNPRGTFVSDYSAPITIYDVSNVTLFKCKSNKSTSMAFPVWRSHDITFDSCVCEDSSADGFQIGRNSYNVMLVNCKAFNTGDDSFAVVSYLTTNPCYNITIDNCISINSHTRGINVSGGHDINISNCIVKECVSSGLRIWREDIGFYTHNAYNINVVNCQFINFGNGASDSTLGGLWIANQTAYSGNNSYDNYDMNIAISNCKFITTYTQSCATLRFINNVQISNCYFNTPSRGIYLLGSCENFKFSNNVVCAQYTSGVFNADITGSINLNTALNHIYVTDNIFTNKGYVRVVTLGKASNSFIGNLVFKDNTFKLVDVEGTPTTAIYRIDADSFIDWLLTDITLTLSVDSEMKIKTKPLNVSTASPGTSVFWKSFAAGTAYIRDSTGVIYKKLSDGTWTQ